METHIIMDDKAKRNYCILAFLPNLAWGFTLIYYLMTMGPIIPPKAMPDGIALATITAQNYTTLLIFGVCSAIISAIVLIVFIIHIAQIKTMNSATKAMWLLILFAIMPFGLLLFWFMHIKNESVHTPIHPNIA